MICNLHTIRFLNTNECSNYGLSYLDDYVGILRWSFCFSRLYMAVWAIYCYFIIDNCFNFLENLQKERNIPSKNYKNKAFPWKINVNISYLETFSK